MLGVIITASLEYTRPEIKLKKNVTKSSPAGSLNKWAKKLGVFAANEAKMEMNELRA